ncbi:hypothetical protein AVEN_96115-1 [Araneus ventricosus]|uniref:Uncharacterized protein n=1 Tax=Araneus ventricosus TaxID=182803 RepID=A0A4Y2Q8B9_ARAVE|nr:hypothetical protein AVEN_96115-1 [Araneus ventricosus]
MHRLHLCVVSSQSRFISVVMFSFPQAQFPREKESSTSHVSRRSQASYTWWSLRGRLRKATTNAEESISVRDAFGVGYEEISSTLSYHTCIAPLVGKLENLPQPLGIWMFSRWSPGSTIVQWSERKAELHSLR